MAADCDLMAASSVGETIPSGRPADLGRAHPQSPALGGSGTKAEREPVACWQSGCRPSETRTHESTNSKCEVPCSPYSLKRYCPRASEKFVQIASHVSSMMGI